MGERGYRAGMVNEYVNAYNDRLGMFPGLRYFL